MNISARANFTPERPLIAGFTISGELPVRVLVRAAGPSLSSFGVPEALGDPRLTLFEGQQAIWDNDNWGSNNVITAPALTHVFGTVGAFPFADNSSDSATVLTLAPGSYTAVVTAAGQNGGQP